MLLFLSLVYDFIIKFYLEFSVLYETAINFHWNIIFLWWKIIYDKRKYWLKFGFGYRNQLQIKCVKLVCKFSHSR